MRHIGYGPTYRELAELIGVASVNAVVGHLHALRAKGIVTWHPQRPRSLKLTAKRKARPLLPYRGLIG